MEWQKVAKGLVGISGLGITGLLTWLFLLSGMSYVHSGDSYIYETEDGNFQADAYINVTTTYWNICFAGYNGTQYEDEILFKKVATSRTLHVNLDKVDNIIDTQPTTEVDWLVPARGVGNWRPIQDGDCWERGKNNRIKLVAHPETPEQTIKWGFKIGDEIDIDPEFIGLDQLDYDKPGLIREVNIAEIDKVFTKLVSNKDKGESEFMLNNDYGYDIGISAFRLNFLNISGKVLDYKVYVWDNVTEIEFEDQYFIKEVCRNITINDTKIPTIKEVCKNQSVYVGQTNKTKIIEKYVLAKYIKNGVHKYKINSKIEWGDFGYELEWVPEVIIGDTIYKQEKWDWWNESYNFCRDINVTNMEDVNQVNFRYHINITNTTHMGGNLATVRFTNGTCHEAGVEIYYDIVSIVGDSADVYVNVPDLPVGVTGIAIYYNNSESLTGAQPELTYDNDQMAALHLEESVGIRLDSTSHENNGTETADVNSAPGKIGLANRGDGDSGWLDLGGDASLKMLDTLTYCWWAQKHEDIHNYFDRIGTGGQDNIAIYVANTDDVTMGSRNGWIMVTTYVGNSMSHMCFTYDGSNTRIYINGTLKATSAPFTLAAPVGDTHLMVGGGETPTNFMDVTMDEVFISNSTRSAEYINISFQMTQFQSDFVDISREILSTEVVVGTPVISTPTIKPDSPIPNQDITCNATVTGLNTTWIVEYRWFNGTIEMLNGNTSNVANNTNTLISTLGSGNTSSGETWNCSVKTWNSDFSKYSVIKSAGVTIGYYMMEGTVTNGGVGIDNATVWLYYQNDTEYKRLKTNSTGHWNATIYDTSIKYTACTYDQANESLSGYCAPFIDVP